MAKLNIIKIPINGKTNKYIKIMAKKQIIRLTEGDLHKIIKESVNRILNEQAFSDEELKDFLMQQHYPNRTPEEQESAFNRDFEIAQKRFGSEDDKNGLNAYEKFKRDIADSKARLELSMMDSRLGNNNVHDYKGKGAMYAMGASSYGKEGEEFARNDKGVGVYPRYDMDESVRRSLREAFSDVYQPHNFSDPNKEYCNGFVVVDGTRAVLGQYDEYEEAVEDAKEMARRNKFGTYEVYGCDKDGYALEEDYPEDNTLVYSTDEDFA